MYPTAKQPVPTVVSLPADQLSRAAFPGQASTNGRQENACWVCVCGVICLVLVLARLPALGLPVANLQVTVASGVGPEVPVPKGALGVSMFGGVIGCLQTATSSSCGPQNFATLFPFTTVAVPVVAALVMILTVIISVVIIAATILVATGLRCGGILPCCVSGPCNGCAQWTRVAVMVCSVLVHVLAIIPPAMLGWWTRNNDFGGGNYVVVERSYAAYFWVICVTTLLSAITFALMALVYKPVAAAVPVAQPIVQVTSAY
jgi:hypothetical protein